MSDEATWLSLLGPDASPADLPGLRMKHLDGDEEADEYDMDMSEQGAVWLVGEGRWEKKKVEGS